MDLAKLMLIRDPNGRPEALHCLSFLRDMSANFAAMKDGMKGWIRRDQRHRPQVVICLNSIFAFGGNREDISALMSTYGRGSYKINHNGQQEVVITVAPAVSLISDQFQHLHDAFQELIAEELVNTELRDEDFESVTEWDEDDPVDGP